MQKILETIKKIFYRIKLSKIQVNYIKLNKSRFSEVDNKDHNGYVLLDFLYSYPVIEVQAFLSNYLTKKYNLKAKYYFFEYDILDSLGIPKRFLRKIYKSFNVSHGFTFNLLFTPIAFFKSFKLYQRINSRNDVKKISIEGISIGPLIYDTYLRKYSQKTIEEKNLALFKIIFIALIIFFSIRKFFKKHDIKYIIAGDSAYIYSGLVARYAVTKGITVLSMVEAKGFLLTKMTDNFFRRFPFWNYRIDFAKLDQHKQMKAIDDAKDLLKERVTGLNSSPYMKESSFIKYLKIKDKVLRDTNNSKILVCLHDFLDSPSIYRYMLFNDFWQWIIFTLEHAKKTTFEWYVKPHPNALPQNKKFVQALIDKYENIENIIFLDKTTSNSQVIAEGIDSVFTVYGSVGHEFAFYKIPVVNAGDNPHIEYSFNLHPRTIGEYKTYICQANSLSVRVDQRELAEFFYMHYLHNVPLELLHPVYPPDDYVEQYELGNYSSKQKRIFYHKSDCTLEYFMNKYNSQRHIIINNYLDNRI